MEPIAMHQDEPGIPDPGTRLDEQLASFAERGHLRLPRAFSPDLAARIRERMWAELREDFGIERDDPRTWHQPRRSLRTAKRDPLQHAIATPALVAALDALLGRGRWNPPSNWGVVLVTLPDRVHGEWILPSSGWHYDFDLEENATALAGVQVFTFFGDVGPHGGGTLIAEGSHRLLRRFFAELTPVERRAGHRELRRRFLRHDPWLRTLTSAGASDRVEQCMGEPRCVRGVPVRVIELTGQPGDAVLCHPLMLHVGAPNHSDTPRFMRSQRICVDGARAEDGSDGQP